MRDEGGTCDKCSVSSNSTFEGIWQLLSHMHRSLYSAYHEMLDGVQAHEVWHAESEAFGTNFSLPKNTMDTALLDSTQQDKN